MLLLEFIEGLRFVLEPAVDNIGVEAVAHQVLTGLLHFFFEMILNGTWLFFDSTFRSLFSVRVAFIHLERVVLVVQSSWGGTEAVKAECCTCLVSLSLNAGKNILDLRIFVIKGLTVDKGVSSHPLNDLLVGLSIHFHATDGQIFDLGNEIVVWLGNSTLVILESLNELHVQSSRFSPFAFEPFHDSGIVGVGQGDGGLLGPNELELSGFVFLEELLGEGRLGLWDVFTGFSGSDISWYFRLG